MNTLRISTHPDSRVLAFGNRLEMALHRRVELTISSKASTPSAFETVRSLLDMGRTDAALRIFDRIHAPEWTTVTETSQRFDHDVVEPIVSEILNLPVRTLDGLIVKAKALRADIAEIDWDCDLDALGYVEQRFRELVETILALRDGDNTIGKAQSKETQS